MNLNPDLGSIRDPRGKVYLGDNRVFRTVSHFAVNELLAVRETGLITELVQQGQLLPEEQVSISSLQTLQEDVALVFAHPKLSLITYPYEWTFGALQDAALLHLDIQLQALQKNVSLVDASAYNIQFQNTVPIFIDHLAFKMYESGEFWLAHRQFCEQFLYPLLLQARVGLPFQSLYRGNLYGVNADALLSVLAWWQCFSWPILREIILPRRFAGSKQTVSTEISKKLHFPKSVYESHLKNLRAWIVSLKPKLKQKITWQNYTKDKPYASLAQPQKAQIVAQFIQATQPQQLWDLGCNTGEYAQIALQNGAAHVIGLEQDHSALEVAYQTAKAKRLAFLPLYTDLLNPSPDQGFAQCERKGLLARCLNADALICLAMVHHLALAQAISLQVLIPWLVNMAPVGLIEFVHPEDLEAAAMLHWLPNAAQNYNYEHFLQLLQQVARVVQIFPLTQMERTLIWYERIDAKN